MKRTSCRSPHHETNEEGNITQFILSEKRHDDKHLAGKGNRTHKKGVM